MAYLTDLKYVNGQWRDQLSDDTIYGTAANDSVTLYGGDDFFNDIDGGNDTVYDIANQYGGHSGQDVISTGVGNDTVITSLDSPNSIYNYGGQGYYGGVGTDMLNFTPNETGVLADLANGYAKNNITGESTQINSFENLIGSTYNDYLYGDSGSNYINGYDGDDQIDGRGGNDDIQGGNGRDIIYTGEGSDAAAGGAGADRVYGQAGFDTLRGGTDNDYLGGGDGDDVLYGDTGNDTLSGDLGNDRLFGGDGLDLLTGADGNDIIRGDAGNDILFGNAGADYLYGDAGNDQLTGGLGRDYMHGGAGADVFFFRNVAESGNNSLADWLTDFTHNVDDINVSSIDANTGRSGNQAFKFIGDDALDDAGDVNYAYVGNTTVIKFNTDNDDAAEMTITLSGHVVVSASDFVL